MKPGDLIQDVALNAQPYWEVEENDRFKEKRVNLKPIGPNPFLTGVGAGGAKILPSDIKVLTGEYERERVAAIEELIKKGEYKNIGDVKYMLLGTVATNFGPNGPQGGWYNAHDRSSRGGRQGMTPEQVVQADAQTLRDLGFEISESAFDGSIPADEWTQFVEGPYGYFKDWERTPPCDTEIFKERMMADYRKRGLLDDEYRALELPKNLALWDDAIALWEEHGGLSHDDIMALSDSGELQWDLRGKIMGIWKFLVFATASEDPSEPIRRALQEYIKNQNHYGDPIDLEDFVDQMEGLVDWDAMNNLFPSRNFIDNEEDFEAAKQGVREILEPIAERAYEMTKKSVGTVIDLMDIGQEAAFHGYKAVKLEGVRGCFPDTEILVFNPDDLEMIEEIET